MKAKGEAWGGAGTNQKFGINIHILLYSGEGNGNPLQYSCLENPMHGGAWQATVHGVTRVGHDLVTKPPTTTTI